MKINYNSIWNFLMILVLFEPNIAVKFNMVNYVFIVGAAISFMFSAYKIVKEYNSLYSITLVMILYRLLLIFTTIYSKGDILKVGYQSIVIITLMLYAEYYYRKNDLNKLIQILANIFTIYLLINIIGYIAFPSGLYKQREGIHFLGFRTRFTEYSMILLLLALLNYRINCKNKKLLTFRIIIVILNIFIPHIATAITGIILFLITYFILNKIKYVNYKIVFFIAILITILIVFFRIQNIFSFFIVDLLHKNITLTGRTEIWDRAYEYIFDKQFIIGHGMKTDGNFILWEGSLWQAHNQLLQTLYEGGLIGTCLYYGAFNIALSKLNKFKNNNKKMKNLICAMYFSFGIMMITEIYGYYLPTYILILLAYYFDKINIYKIKEEKT